MCTVLRCRVCRVVRNSYDLSWKIALTFRQNFIPLSTPRWNVYNMSHNVHSILRLIDDVKNYGSLDNFLFESFMRPLKKKKRLGLVRSPCNGRLIVLLKTVSIIITLCIFKINYPKTFGRIDTCCKLKENLVTEKFLFVTVYMV